MSSRPSRGAARLAAILDALPDALLLVNANGTVVNANSIALDTFEAPGTALVGRGLLDLLPAFDSKRIPGTMRRPDPQEGPRTRPTRMIARRTDGSEIPVEVTSANLEDSRTPYADGHVPYTGDELLMLVVRDLTGTLDTETELARQQRQTEMILRAASEGVVGVDTDGKVVLVNPAAAQILGFRAGDLGGQALHPLIHHSRADGSPLPYEETPLADTLRSGRKHRVRGQVLWTKDGRGVPVDLTTAPVREGEVLVGAVMTFADRSRLNALAARHAQLRAVLDASLRGPLAELRAELIELSDDPAAQLWPEANQTMRHLVAGYTRMTALIDNVLDYQRLDTGAERLERERVGLDEVIAAAVEGAVELIGPGRAQYAVHAPPIRAVVDGVRLAQAIAHLIVDVAGVDAAGRTAVSHGDSTIVVAAAKRGDVVRIEVRGPHNGGSPVHLPIVRGVVERHGGVFQTHDVPGGQGSAYVLEVPLGDVGDEDDETAEGAGQDGRADNDSGMTVMPLPSDPVRGTTAGALGARGAEAPPPGRPPGAREPIALPPGTGGGVSQPTGRRRAVRDSGSNGVPVPARPQLEAHNGTHGAGFAMTGTDGRGVPLPGLPAELPQGVNGQQPAGRRARRSLDGTPQPVPPRTVHALPPAGTPAPPNRLALPGQATGEGPRWPDPQEAHSGTYPVRQPARPGLELPPALPSGGTVNGFPVAPQGEPESRPGTHAGVPAGPQGAGTDGHGTAFPEPTGRRARRPQTAPHPGAMPPAADGAARHGGMGGPELPEVRDLPGEDDVQQGQGMPFPSQVTGALPVRAVPGHPQGEAQGRQLPHVPQQQTPVQAAGQGGAGGPGRRRRLATPQPQPQDAAVTGASPVRPPQPQPGGPGQSAHQGPQAQPGGHEVAQRHPRPAPPQDLQGPGTASRPHAGGQRAGGNPAFHPSETQGHGQTFAIGAPAEGAEGPEMLDGPGGAVEVMGAAREAEYDGPRRLLVWPEPDVSTRQALTDRGYRPVTVRSREEVDAQVAQFPAALFVDPLTGPITRTALQSLRAAAVAAEVPVLVTAGLGQATREAAYGADPAVLLKALAPRDSDRHPPRVLLVESHRDIAGAFAATLERRGMQVAHAASEEDAAALAEQMLPNLVVMDLLLIRRDRLGIVDWLRANGLLNRTPLVVYTSVDIDAAELPRLSSGETVLFLAERSTSPEVQGRIVDMLGKIGTDL